MKTKEDTSLNQSDLCETAGNLNQELIRQQLCQQINGEIS